MRGASCELAVGGGSGDEREEPLGEAFGGPSGNGSSCEQCAPSLEEPDLRARTTALRSRAADDESRAADDEAEPCRPCAEVDPALDDDEADPTRSFAADNDAAPTFCLAFEVDADPTRLAALDDDEADAEPCRVEAEPCRVEAEPCRAEEAELLRAPCAVFEA